MSWQLIIASGFCGTNRTKCAMLFVDDSIGYAGWAWRILVRILLVFARSTYRGVIWNAAIAEPDNMYKYLHPAQKRLALQILPPPAKCLTSLRLKSQEAAGWPCS